MRMDIYPHKINTTGNCHVNKLLQKCELPRTPLFSIRCHHTHLFTQQIGDYPAHTVLLFIARQMNEQIL